MSNWRQASINAIFSALKDLPPDADKRKAIDAAYPFYEAASFRMNYSSEKCLRKYHPYKIWLDERSLEKSPQRGEPAHGAFRRKTLIQLGLWQPPSNRHCKYHSNDQTCLLCQNINV